MPLSEKDRVERLVLRYLNFHTRSAVPLAADGESCERFECGDSSVLLNTLADMYARNLFHLRPSPGRWRDSARTDTLVPEERGRSTGELRRALERVIEAGATAMITSEGMRRYSQLSSKTREIRQEDWLRAQEEAGREEGGGGHAAP